MPGYGDKAFVKHCFTEMVTWSVITVLVHHVTPQTDWRLDAWNIITLINNSVAEAIASHNMDVLLQRSHCTSFNTAESLPQS